MLLAVRCEVLREVSEACSASRHAFWRDVLAVRAADAADDATTVAAGALMLAFPSSYNHNVRHQ